MQNHHPDEKSTPPQKIAQQNFFSRRTHFGQIAVDTQFLSCYSIHMRTCNKCSRTLELEHYHVDRTKPQGRSRTCRDCVRTRAHERYLRNTGRSRALSRTSRPCRECHRNLTVEHYKLPNSWYCKPCVRVRKERARLAQPDSQCDTCGIVKSQLYMRKLS